METYAACELAGFIAATVNWRLAPPEIAYILKDSTPEILFFEAQYSGVVNEVRGGLPDIKACVCFGGDAPDWALSYEAFLATGDPRRRAEPSGAGRDHASDLYERHDGARQRRHAHPQGRDRHRPADGD